MYYTPATERTIYFIGTTTGQSSIMKVFPRWAEALKLNAVIKGIDFIPDEGAQDTGKPCGSSRAIRSLSVLSSRRIR
jgi:shikimate 5-dehydrogenase